MSYLNKVGEKFFGCVLDLGIRHVAYIFSYGKNVDELNNSIKDLGLAKERVDHLRDEAEKNLHNIEGQVTEWFRKVEECKTEVEEFGNDEGHRKRRLLHDLFPYLWNRYRLGKQAVEITEDVKKLIDECSKFKEVAYRENITSNDVTLSNAGYVEFGSRKSIMKDVMAKLEDSTVRMIGLHGPGGVGKSTLIKAIAKKSQEKKLFDVVVKVEITANPNPQKIQEEIAYVLGLRLEGEGENVRADSLRRRLKQEKESILVILDDLWDKLDLNKLGIPLDGDVDDKQGPKDDNKEKCLVDYKLRIPFDCNVDNNDLSKKTSNAKQGPKDANKEKSLGDCKGCKILLTSRDKNLLTDKMEVKSTFCVEKLDDEDTLRLFQKEARIQGEMSKGKQEIVKKYCAGLPMAIVTVGRALRDKSDSEWEKLKNQDLVGVQNSMEISVKMSYDRLENEELKSIFFLCAQMGHQPLIMDLVKYCFGLGILKGVYSLGEARVRISTSILKLKDSGLVLDGSSSIHFNMHDLVRDAALSIAHKEQNVFTLRNDKLDVWPELERCTSISICNSHIIDGLPEEINCPQLKFFQIDSDDPSLKVPDSFFKGMKKLHVLMLTGIQLSSLPSSIESLTDLRLLCLERCSLNKNLSIIGKLKKLRILSFSGSRIENLPAELKDLDKLQLLDINNCSVVKRIPPNLISRLTSLEELYVRKSFIDMSVEGERKPFQISFLSELKHLHQLHVVDLSIPCAEVFPKELFFDKLNDYKIVIGDFKMLLVGDFRMPNKYEKVRSLALQVKNGVEIHSHRGIKLLFKRVENLFLGELNGVKNVIDDLNLDGFPDLKHLSITNNDGIKYINSMDLSHSQDVFPNLESLCLYKLTNLEMICGSPVTIVSFAKLKTIKVNGCTHLKNLFSFYRDKFFASLETIDVSECGSLKEIVEILVNPDKVEFLKLHTLTLQSLSSFTSFYNTVEGRSVPRLTECSDMDPPLFGELVEIPNLESLNLSSIGIHKIWSDQLLPSFCFQNLVKLVVNGCHNLRYLCSLSVASGLKKLKALFVSYCPLMEKIFGTVGNNADKVCVFPKLEEIHLSQMDKLTDLWQAEVSVDSFSSLTSVNIYHCNKLDTVFPSHMEGWFASLNSLKVSNCELVEVIFEIKDSQQVDASGGIDTNFQVLDVSGLPKLKQVWSRDPGGILNFKKLQSIQVSSCQRLRNVFPASVAKDVPKLEYMSVQYCDKIKEIVSFEDGSETNTEQLVFPELTYMNLGDLSRIQHFYKGRHPIECPKLKTLEVEKCMKLKTFPTGETTNEEDEAVFSVEKIFPNLEYLYIDFDEAQKWLLSNTVKHRMHRLKELRLGKVNDGKRLCQILYRMPYLEKLYLWSSKIEDLILESSESLLGTVLQLKELVLWSSEIKDIGFERDPVLQRLELLSIYMCNQLKNLAPPSASLAYLTNLEVKYCDGLRNLMASSTAKSLVQLKSMKINECKWVEEIVTNEGNEEEEQIVFGKLITIELEGLEKLKSFCSYKNYEFEFPSLEILIVRECPLMQTFSEGGVRAPKLQNIVAAVEAKEEVKWQWKGDLNATIQKAFIYKFSEYARTVSSLSLGDRYSSKIQDTWFGSLGSRQISNRYSPVIQEIWRGSRQIPNGCFSNLYSLTLDGCKFLSDVVLPFFLLPFLTNLKELEVLDCYSVKSIFDVNCITQERDRKPLPFALKQLTLRRLPNLENVWNEDPHGILSMQLLQHVSVDYCNCLTSVFPASVAKDLVKLVVKDCEELMQIVAEHNADPRGANLELTFPCPCVRSLELQGLPKFKYFYYCSPQKLHCLSLGEKGLEMIKHGEFQRNLLHKLQVLTLPFHIGSNVLPYEILQEVPNMEKLVVCDCSFKEIFCCQSPNVDYTELLLGDLVPCTVSFSNLTYLQVERCNCLLYLFTSSTAKSLAQLIRMEISKCNSIEEVVSKEGGESHENEIIFPQLNCLTLIELPELRSFYRGSLLSLPSLEELSVIDCDWMETFCPGTLKADKLLRVELDFDVIKLENDLNSTMQGEFVAKWLNSGRLYLKNSRLEEIWLRLDSMQLPDLCFSNLYFLIVDGCHFLSDAVLPFNLLPLLPQLEELEVRNCDFVKIIFDVKCLTQDTEMTNLEKLILERLPNLENVCNAYPKETNLELTFPQLKSLKLCDLPKLKYDMFKLFTHLEHLTLGEHELKMILRGEFQGNHLHKLRVLALFIHIESDVFLQQVPNIETLQVRDGSFIETFCFDRLNVDEAGLLSQWKVLCLDSLPELVSIGSENSRIVPFLRNLETLEVISCFSSINLVRSQVSFSNLTYLEVKSCNSLPYLFTSSTAKSLGQLQTMTIGWCDSIEEIVSKEEDESHENEIIFQQLNCLILEYLGKLRRFYKGSLSFPSLKKLSVINCDWMETLCAGTVKTDKLLEVKFELLGGVIPLETDLNSAMQDR